MEADKKACEFHPLISGGYGFTWEHSALGFSSAHLLSGVQSPESLVRGGDVAQAPSVTGLVHRLGLPKFLISPADFSPIARGTS